MLNVAKHAVDIIAADSTVLSVQLNITLSPLASHLV